MKRKVIGVAGAGVIAVGFLIFYYLYAGGTTPPGQPPLVRLNSSNLSALTEGFNESATSVRLLVMLSPT